MSQLSLRAYFLETLRDYCRERGSSPYIWVRVDHGCEVPQQYVDEAGVIVLDLSDSAVHNYRIEDNAVCFQARFGEYDEVHDLRIPICRIGQMASDDSQHSAAMFIVSPSEEASQPAAFRRPTRVK